MPKQLSWGIIPDSYAGANAQKNGGQMYIYNIERPFSEANGYTIQDIHISATQAPSSAGNGVHLTWNIRAPGSTVVGTCHYFLTYNAASHTFYYSGTDILTDFPNCPQALRDTLMNSSMGILSGFTAVVTGLNGWLRRMLRASDRPDPLRLEALQLDTVP